MKSIRTGLRHLKALRRRIAGAGLVLRVGKKNPQAQRGERMQVLANTRNASGLARAYRYEVARLAAADRLCAPSDVASTFLILGQPQSYRKLLWKPSKGFRDGYRIGLWVTEFEVMPPEWAFAADIVHEIWTPSSFSARAIAASVGVPVKVVPHAVVTPATRPMDRARFGVAPNAFLCLAIMDLRTCPDRKNPLDHVEAWRRAFGDDPSAHLLMKVSFKKATMFMRSALYARIGNARNITLIEDTFSDEDMSAFQNMGDAYLSLHRAEGYGLNIHEMLAFGKPVVATGWSGNMEYMTSFKTAMPIPYQLVSYADPTFHYEDVGLQWAQPDLDAAANALRHIRQNLGRS